MRTSYQLGQGILKGEVSLYHWPPVWLVWNQLYDNWQFLFLFAKLTNPNQSNTRSMVQWYFPPLVFPGWGYAMQCMARFYILTFQCAWTASCQSTKRRVDQKSKHRYHECKICQLLHPRLSVLNVSWHFKPFLTFRVMPRLHWRSGRRRKRKNACDGDCGFAYLASLGLTTTNTNSPLYCRTNGG